MKKKPGYEELRHDLDTKMLQASNLPTAPERQGFINRTFTSIHKAYQEKQVNHAQYVKLINRLAAYRQGEFNDYIDTLAGAAQLGMLEMAIQGELSELTPEASRQRRQAITDLTGVQPIQPDTERETEQEKCEVCEKPDGPFIKVEVSNDGDEYKWLLACSDNCLHQITLRWKQIGEIIRP